MKMTMEEARQISGEILGLPDPVFQRAMIAAKEMPEMKAEHWPPMTMALAIMGIGKAHEAEDIASELTDALALVSKAENEWRTKRRTN